MSTILVIDDHIQNARLAQKLLSNSGHEVFIASNSEAGLKLFAETAPDLLLIDVESAQMDGESMVGFLRDSIKNLETPIVAYTAWCEDIVSEKVKETRCNGAILKPIDTHAFVGEVNAYLN